MFNCYKHTASNEQHKWRLCQTEGKNSWLFKGGIGGSKWHEERQIPGVQPSKMIQSTVK